MNRSPILSSSTYKQLKYIEFSCQSQAAAHNEVAMKFVVFTLERRYFVLSLGMISLSQVPEPGKPLQRNNR